MGCGPCRGWGQRAERVCARVCTNVPLASVPERGVCVRTYCWGGSESHSGSCCFRVHIRTAVPDMQGKGRKGPEMRLEKQGLISAAHPSQRPSSGRYRNPLAHRAQQGQSWPCPLHRVWPALGWGSTGSERGRWGEGVGPS